jgi:hypothetical protein
VTTAEGDSSGIVAVEQALPLLVEKKNFEPIIQVLDFMNELFSSKFQVPGPGALIIRERGT